MWGYDRVGDENSLVPYKTQDEHFELFCMVLERGFAIHTCHSDRLLVEFRLTDTGSRRYLPKVNPKTGVSFRIPEAWLKPSDLYLYYDPSSDADIPELAYYRPDDSVFIPFDYENLNLQDQRQTGFVLPVVKLSTLKGLHYVKDIACLQMFELDFNKLFEADVVLAEQLRSLLALKMDRFIEFSHPWLQASHAEKVAHEYLASHKPKNVGQPRQSLSSQPSSNDSEFLSWDS